MSWKKSKKFKFLRPLQRAKIWDAPPRGARWYLKENTVEFLVFTVLTTEFLQEKQVKFGKKSSALQRVCHSSDQARRAV